MRKKILFSLCAFITSLGLLTSCSGNKIEDQIVVNVDEYCEHNISKTINVSGKIENAQSTPFTVSTNIDNFCVKKINVQVGDYVNIGDVICEFDTQDVERRISDIEKRLDNAKDIDEKTLDDMKIQLSGKEKLQSLKLDQINRKLDDNKEKYNNAENMYNDAKNNYENALNNYNEAENNLKNVSTTDEIAYYSGLCTLYQSQLSMYSEEMKNCKNIIASAEQEINNYENEYSMVKIETDNELDSIKYDINSYKSKAEDTSTLKQLKEDVENSIIYSEYSGIIQQVNISEGQISSEKNLVTIIDDNDKIVHVLLNDSDFISVKEGMKALITFSSNSDPISGEVYKINRIKGSDGFDVYIRCNVTDDMCIGMNVSSNIIILEKDALSVPKNSVIEENNNKYVFALSAINGQNTVKKCKIETGIESDEYIEITGGDLINGDDIIVSNIDSLKDGMMVRLANN